MPRPSKNAVKAHCSAEATPDMEMPDSLASMIDAALEKYFARAEISNKEHFSRMEQRFDSLQSELSSLKEETRALRADHSGLLKRTEKLERIAASRAVSATVVDLKLADLEDRSRRNNICLHGLPEEAEGTNAIQYLVKQFGQWSPSLGDPPPEIMRAHRIGPPRRGSKPRVLIMQCLRYTDRNRILKAMRDRASPVEGADKEIRCTPDFSAFTRGRRRACYPIMEKAREAGFQAFLLYPATIKLSKGHEHNTFDDPSKADNFLDNLAT